MAGPNIFATGNGNAFHTDIAKLNLGLAGEKFGIVLRRTRKNLYGSGRSLMFHCVLKA